MIVVAGVSKTFESAGGPVAALDSVSFRIERGQFVSIVGPSGCGKTTLLRIIGGTLAPSGGSVTVNGRTTHGPSADVGIVFQTPILFPWRTVLENVLLPADVRGRSRASLEEPALALLAAAGLGGFERAYPARLSGGMQQRAAICRALLYEPAALLLDEPFGALDALTREVMNAELLRMCERSTPAVLLITHSIVEAVFLSDQVLVMSGRPGAVVASIPVDLPRPRPLDLMGTPHFAELTQMVRSELVRHHGLVAD